jgi:hypothetical protein
VSTKALKRTEVPISFSLDQFAAHVVIASRPNAVSGADFELGDGYVSESSNNNG